MRGGASSDEVNAGRRVRRRRSAWKRLRDRLEACAVLGLFALARIAPAALLIRCGTLLGGVVGRCDRGRRAVALANLELAYGATLDAAGRRGIVDGLYRHFGRMLFEYLVLLAKPGLQPPSRFLRLDGVAAAREAVAQHGAVIIVTLHQGHWELLGGAISEQVARVHAVMQPVRNPALHRRVVELRSRLGMGMIERENAVVNLFRCLRRKRTVGLLCDLDQEESPAFIDFFGVPAATVRTPAVLAMRTGTPIVLASSWSTGRPLEYGGVLAPPLLADPAADPETEERRILGAINRQYEAFIRAHPEQWNWIHPRWKTRPPASAQPPRAS